MPFTTEEAARAQARLAAIEPMIDHMGTIYEMVATGAVVDAEVLGVFTTVIGDLRAMITGYLNALTEVGDRAPVDQPAASQGRLRIETVKTVLGHLQRTLPAMSAPLATNEEGDVIASLTDAQKGALETDLDRGVARLISELNR